MDEVSLASGVDARRDLQKIMVQKIMVLESREGLTGIIVGMGCIGVLLTAWLVISQPFRGPICPDLLGIPACFAVLGWVPERERNPRRFSGDYPSDPKYSKLELRGGLPA